MALHPAVRVDALPAGQWDEWVRSRSGHLLQSYLWGDFKSAFGWRPYRLAVLDDNRIVAAAQVLFRPLPGGLLTTAYIPRGPVMEPDNPNAPQMLSAIHRICRAHRAISCKVEPDWANAPETRRWLQEHGFQLSRQTVQPPRSVVVDLRPDEPAILAQMKSKTRYNVRLAERRGVSVRIGVESDLPTFYRLLQATSIRDQFSIHEEKYYAHGWRTFARQSLAALLLAEHDGRTIAGLVVYAWGKSSIYMYGASADEGRMHMPNHLLQWEAMRWAKARGCECYDLWGIPDLNDPDIGPDVIQAETSGALSTDMGGLYRFKCGFGGQIVRAVGAYDFIYNRPLYLAFCSLWERRRNQAAAH